MTYALLRLTAGSYDLCIEDVIIGSAVREVSADGGGRGWPARLLNDLPPDQRPQPFLEIEHAFPMLNALTTWLGGAMVQAMSADPAEPTIS